MPEKSPLALKSVAIPFWHTTSDTGVVLPAFLDKHTLAEIKTRAIHPTDILISSYPKSGSTWMKTMLGELLKSDHIPMFCAVPGHYISDIPAPRVFKEHLPVDLMPEQLLTTGCKVIYLVRNPKDTVVSYQHHMTLFKMDDYSEDIHTMTRLFCEDKTQFGGWSGHISGWCYNGALSPHNLLIVTYEDMVRDCLSVMRRVVEFLEITVEEDTLARVVAGAQFDVMKQKDLSHVPGCPSFRAKHALKDDTVHFLREGKVGGWKRELSVADSELIDEYVERLPQLVKERLQALGAV